MFLELSIPARDFGRLVRDELEERLGDLLDSAGIGAITGGGAGLGHVTIDLEVTANDADSAMVALIPILRGAGLPGTTIIRAARPDSRVWNLGVV